MLINKKRIRSVSKYVSHIADGETFYIGLPVTREMESVLAGIGFKNLNVGEVIVPSPVFGAISRFNANGKEIPQRHLPKETAYRQQWRDWKDWHGNEHSRIVDIPYPRYPRKFINPPWVELSIVQHQGTKFILAGREIVKGETPEEDILHHINLMLEIFKQVVILQENMERYEVPKVVKLSWDILPSGEMPWEQFNRHLSPVVDKMADGKRKIFRQRLETISSYKPDFHAIGENGYHGYVIFGFTKLNLYIFESAEYGNATYVFEGDWEKISKMTKAEILNANLHKERFVHLVSWENQVAKLFKTNPKKRIS